MTNSFNTPVSRALSDALHETLHRHHEGFNLLQGRVDVRRHPDPLVVELLAWQGPLANGRYDDSVLVPQERRDLRRLYPIDSNHSQPPGLPRFETGEDLDPRMLLELVGPAESQVTQARGFALAADGLVEGEGFGDRRARRCRHGPDLFELTNVVGLPGGGSLQRPDPGNVLLRHIQEAGAERSKEPLVQAHPIAVAFEIP